MHDDFVYVSHHKENIKAILEKYNKNISDEVLIQTLQYCEAYLSRKKVQKFSVVSDLKKFQSKLNKIKEKLSYNAYFEINYILNNFSEDLAKTIGTLDKRRQQKYAYDMFILDLANLYMTVTKKKPGKPYLKDKKNKIYRGPFFVFVNSIITIIDKEEPHSPTLKSAINKVLDSMQHPS